MINITAKDEGEQIAMTCEIRGTGLEIVEEAFAIVIDLPKRIREANPALYHAFMLKVASEAMLENAEEEESDALN